MNLQMGEWAGPGCLMNGPYLEREVMCMVIGLLWRKLSAPARQSCSNKRWMLEQFLLPYFNFLKIVFGVCPVTLCKEQSPAPSSPAPHSFSLLNELVEQAGQEQRNLAHLSAAFP